MKHLVTLTVLILFGLNGLAQTKNFKVFKDRAMKNLEYLSNDYEIKNRVQIDDKGIIIYTDHSRRAKDLVLYWTDLPKFVDIIENWDYYDMVKTFAQKGQQAFYDQYGNTEYYHYYKELPSSFEDLRVALDPGHFGGNLQEANYEMRFTKFRGIDVGQKEDIQFFEADLAYSICQILKQTLEDKYPGIRVMITRPYAASAIGKPFKVWYKNDFRKDLEDALQSGDITKEHYKILIDSSTHERYVFESFYKFLEFRKRVEKINEFHPDITFAVHLNAKEGNRRFGERYLMPVEDNFNMCFVPGAFLNNELSKTDQKVDFIRLLVSTDLEKSVRLGEILMKKHEEILGVPSIPKENDLKVLREVSVATGKPGVYCRNLVLTRMARSVVVYGESLYQDNKDELKKLSQKDYEFFHPELGNIKTSKRCAEIAQAYFEALVEFVEENKKKKEELNITTN